MAGYRSIMRRVRARSFKCGGTERREEIRQSLPESGAGTVLISVRELAIGLAGRCQFWRLGLVGHLTPTVDHGSNGIRDDNISTLGCSIMKLPKRLEWLRFKRLRQWRP